MKTNQPDLWEETNAWPPMVGEVAGKYDDCMSRNSMAAGIVLDKQRQPMMGGVYDYPDEVKAIARKILGR